MTDLFVVCRPEHASGFRLAGLPVRAAATAEAAAAAIAGVAGLVLLEDALQPVRSREGVVLVPFPGPTWSEDAQDDRVLEILRRAIGYRVRL